MRHVLTTLVAVSAVVACGQDVVVPGRTCTAHLRVGLPSPNPLLVPRTLDLSWVTVRDGAETVFEGRVQLFGLDAGAVSIPIVEEATEEPLAVDLATEFRLLLGAYSFTDNPVVFSAFGQTTGFACEADTEPEVPLYIGPARDFAGVTSTLQPVAIGARATAVSGDQVLVTGGDAGSGVGLTTQLYDHVTGELCDETDGCLAASVPARVGHSATLLLDGTVLVIGGRDPAGGTALADAWRIDPSSGVVQSLSLTPSLQPRQRHAATLLGDNLNVPADRRGDVLVVGGCGDTCNGADVHTTALLIDADAGTVQSITLPGTQPLYDATATFLTSGEVLIAGGKDSAGLLTATLELYDTGSGWTSAAAPCPGGATDLCAPRAGHTATELDDGNVLLFGGELGAVPGPVAEVYLLGPQHALPVAELSTVQGRVGHTAINQSCAVPPCRVVIVGGEVSGGVAAAPVLFNTAVSPPLDSATEYVGGWVQLSPAGTSGLRRDHAAAALGDGTVLVVGGNDVAGSSLAVPGALLFGDCEAAGPGTCSGD